MARGQAFQAELNKTPRNTTITTPQHPSNTQGSIICDVRCEIFIVMTVFLSPDLQVIIKVSCVICAFCMMTSMRPCSSPYYAFQQNKVLGKKIELNSINCDVARFFLVFNGYSWVL